MSVQDDLVRLRDERFFQHPYEVFAELREDGPVRRVVLPQGVRAWLVTRYAEARAALADPRLSKDYRVVAPLFDRHREQPRGPVERGAELAAHMLNSDPPDHTRLRKLVTKAFTVRGITGLRPRVEAIAADLLDKMADQDEVDLLDAFAFPLPMTVISELLGVPADDRESFREWTKVVISPASGEEINAAAAAMWGYLTNLLAIKRAAPADDLLTALIQASEDGDRLSETELISMTFLLLLAGHETTVNLIGNGVLSLLGNPDQLALLRTDPTLISDAVDEFLRYEGPVTLATMRFTKEPITLGDTEIPKDEFVVIGLSSANHDPAQFPSPERLDITRKQPGHMAFGHGIHYCVGAPLAKLEGEVAIAALLARFPNLRLAAPQSNLTWRESNLMRGLTSLPVRLR
ncbi:cytochrome P450 [Actinokineospora auranticolor]|uniref:Cytochrome P450 n=1 Tax=Actinokineospora auranticolor TaxID=155976 RepID=A0A2S6GQR1_9PSEU|nr:cytochrome P450 [Actinokineospora auranticolor]PPK67564.1 cytochrome P450 [Actinokineospora auranticolor]